MPTLEEYLTSEYPKIEAQLQEIDLYVSQGANLLRTACQTGDGKPVSWPYSYPEPTLPDEISVSTQTMCAAAAEHLIEAEIGETEPPRLSELVSKVLKSTFDQVSSKVGAGERAWKSSTFGFEDVFTASWLVEVISKRTAPEPIVKAAAGIIVTALKNAVDKQFEKTLFEESNDAGPHPLPLLRVFQSVESIEKSNSIMTTAGLAVPLVADKDLSSAAHWFERNLHRQMSFHHFQDFRFDAAEMVFCLAGVLQTKGITIYDDVITQVLKIVREAQSRSVYWRPYRPMISNERGMTLLPLSIEVATTLLALLERTHNFETYQDTLHKYYRWLVSQRIVQEHKREDDPKQLWAGWHSENAYGLTGVHVWDTARVAMFLLQYGRAIRRQVQKDLRKKSGFTIKDRSALEKTLNEIVPYDEGAAESIKDRIKRAISTDSFSLLLYGPPGTSKTTIVEAIANAKEEWDMVYITPSDFISGGESAIEQKAKLMFETITKMSETVVFFDEIDRLLLDRDSKRYGEQGDIFQFMTPGMLAKLAELRKMKKLGFVIGTNYGERIDRAIKREGRIDKALLCAPPNESARNKLLKGFLQKGLKKPVWTAKHKQLLNAIAKATPCYVYEELRSLVKSTISASNPKNLESVLPKIKKSVTNKRPEVTIDSYKKRLDSTDYPQRPVEEYIALLILTAEAQKVSENKAVAEIKKLKKRYGAVTDDLVPLAKSCGLGKIASVLTEAA
jgi:DNA replication protein DnaC